MAWSGGTFTGLHNWVTDQSNAIKILASRHKAQDDVFIAGINSCIEKSGSNAMTGNFDAGSNRLTSLAAATAATDAPIASQIQDGSLTYAVDTGSANTYAISMTPNETAYAAGQVFFFKATNANSGASTLNVDSIGAIDIKKYHNVALVSGDIVQNQLIGVVYDATTSDFVMITPTPTAPITTTTAAQTNITSLGTLTSLTIDNLTINGNTITADSGALNLTPASGSAIVFDGTINVDAGEVTGATSITSTAFVGDITGDVTGNASGTAATVTGAAQTNITSVGTLTSLAVAGEVTATGFTGTLDGILGSGAAAAASVTTLAVSGAISGASFKDENDMASDSATAVASQQSIKAYVDNNAGNLEPFIPHGLELSRDTDTAHDTIVGTGGCRDATDAQNMTLSSVLTKQIDASWAVGDDQGGLDGTETSAGTPDASTLYAVWLIKRSDTGVVDALYSESFTGPTMPTNYDYKRLIGCVYVNGSNNIADYQWSGRYCRLLNNAPIQDVNDSTITGDTAETGTLTCPPSCIAHVYGHAQNTSNTHTLFRFQIYNADAGEATSVNNSWISWGTNAAAYDYAGCIGQVQVNASSQVDYKCHEDSGTATMSISTFGFWMTTIDKP
jgi:hypothetical protein